MTFSSFCSDIIIGSETIRLRFDNAIPTIEFKEQKFNCLWILCQQCPALCDFTNLKQFSIVSNFLWKGSSFQCVDQIDSYQKNYYAQVELEKKHPTDVFPYRLTDFKIFDLSVMHEPTLFDENLHFFVYDTSTGIPYRVVCPFPYTALSTRVHYQILPLKG